VSEEVGVLKEPRLLARWRSSTEGRLDREYAIGRDRMDICLRYGRTTLGIELKVRCYGRPDPVVKGLKQLDGYLARLGLETGW
jgi:hypothetical protein